MDARGEIYVNKIHNAQFKSHVFGVASIIEQCHKIVDRKVNYA